MLGKSSRIWTVAKHSHKKYIYPLFILNSWEVLSALQEFTILRPPGCLACHVTSCSCVVSMISPLSTIGQDVEERELKRKKLIMVKLHMSHHTCNFTQQTSNNTKITRLTVVRSRCRRRWATPNCLVLTAWKVEWIFVKLHATHNTQHHTGNLYLIGKMKKIFFYSSGVWCNRLKNFP